MWYKIYAILPKYGAYAAHIAQLSENKKVKASDRAKVKGYLKKLIDAKYVLYSAVLWKSLFNFLQSNAEW